MCEESFEERIFVGTSFKKSPAEAINKKQNDLVVFCGHSSENIQRQATFHLTCEKGLDSLGNVGKAVRVKEGFDKSLGKLRAIHSVQRCRVEHNRSCFLLLARRLSTQC